MKLHDVPARDTTPQTLLTPPPTTRAARRRRKQAAVIGGGIHGVTIALALARADVDVTLIERNQKILQGTSAATHNRAHLGFHYPRSVPTAQECKQGLQYFQQTYPEALRYPDASYYVIERDSKSNAREFQAFCDQLQLPYELAWPTEDLLSRQHLTASFKVNEPCFDLPTLASVLHQECQHPNITMLNGQEMIEAEFHNGQHHLTLFDGNLKSQRSYDMVVNATYAFANNVLKLAGLAEDMTEFVFQTTEVVVARIRDRTLPALTVMDGPFISLMPVAGSDDLMLVYDVEHSVHNPTRGKLYQRPNVLPTNWPKMLERGRKYFPFMDSLEFVKSLWGDRPVPTDDSRASRETRFVAHASAPGFFSILDGKFISAPLVANQVVSQLRERNYVA